LICPSVHGSQGPDKASGPEMSLLSDNVFNFKAIHPGRKRTMDIKRTLRKLPKVAKKILRITWDGLKDLFSGLPGDPKKFFILIACLIALIMVSYKMPLLIFMTPIIIFYIGLYIGRRAWEQRKKRRVGKLGSFIVFIISLMIILPCTLGFMIYDNATITAAKLPRKYTDAGSGNGWVLSTDDSMTYSQELERGLARLESRGYEYEGDETPPYRGYIIVLTLKSFPMTTSKPFSERALDKMEGELEDFILRLDAEDYEGLNLDISSKTTGTRTLKSGHEARYFEYTGKIDREPQDQFISRFVSGGKIKIRGETWYCPGSGTIVTVAGAAQYGYTFEPGTFMYGYAYAQRDYPDDMRTYLTMKNQINNVACH